jgi:hypothetical protein
VTKVGHGRCTEGTLALLDGQLVLVESLEDGADVLQVSAPRRVVDEDVIKEDEDKDPDEVLEHVVHQRLVCGRLIGEAKRHHQEFKVVVVGT